MPPLKKSDIQGSAELNLGAERTTPFDLGTGTDLTLDLLRYCQVGCREKSKRELAQAADWTQRTHTASETRTRRAPAMPKLLNDRHDGGGAGVSEHPRFAGLYRLT